MSLNVKLILPGQNAPVPIGQIATNQFEDHEGHYADWKNNGTSEPQVVKVLLDRIEKGTGTRPAGTTILTVAPLPPNIDVPKFVTGDFTTADINSDINSILTDLRQLRLPGGRDFFMRDHDGSILTDGQGNQIKQPYDPVDPVQVGRLALDLYCAIEDLWPGAGKPIKHKHDDLDPNKLLLDEVFRAIVSQSAKLVTDFNKPTGGNFQPLQDFVDELNNSGGKTNNFTNYILPASKAAAAHPIDPTRIEVFMETATNKIVAASVIVGAWQGGTHSNGSTHR